MTRRKTYQVRFMDENHHRFEGSDGWDATGVTVSEAKGMGNRKGAEYVLCSYVTDGGNDRTLRYRLNHVTGKYVQISEDAYWDSFVEDHKIKARRESDRKRREAEGDGIQALVDAGDSYGTARYKVQNCRKSVRIPAL